MNVNTWEKVGEQLKTYYTLHGLEKVPVDAFALWNLIRDALDPAHEETKFHSHFKNFINEANETTPLSPRSWIPMAPALKNSDDSDNLEMKVIK